MNEGHDLPAQAERMSRPVDAVKERLSEYRHVLGEQAIGQADAGLERAAHAIDGAAERLRQRAEEQQGVRRLVAERAAAGVAGTGEFLHRHSVVEVGAAPAVVRSHPFAALLAGLLIGFLLGRLLSHP